MGETIGSRLLGSWYDIAGWWLAAAVFLYFSVANKNLPLQIKQHAPEFLLRRSTCFVAAFFMAAMGVYRAAAPSYTRSPTTSPPVALSTQKGDWEQIYLGGDGSTLSIDKNSITRHGDVIEYSEQLLWKRPKELPMAGKIISMKTRLLIDCSEHTRILLDFMITKVDGSVLFQNKSGNPPKMSISSNPLHPDFISSTYMCK